MCYERGFIRALGSFFLIWACPSLVATIAALTRVGLFAAAPPPADGAGSVTLQGDCISSVLRTRFATATIPHASLMRNWEFRIGNICSFCIPNPLVHFC